MDIPAAPMAAAAASAENLLRLTSSGVLRLVIGGPLPEAFGRMGPPTQTAHTLYQFQQSDRLLAPKLQIQQTSCTIFGK
jgi:hypothetical protein